MENLPISDGRSRKVRNNLFHLGILVNNLEASIKKFSRLLEMEFGPIQEITMHANGTKQKIKLKCAYSMQGPFWLELIEGGGRKGDPYELGGREGFHHLGIWSEEFSEYQERKAKRRLKPVLKLNIMPGDPTFWFSDPRDLSGLRLEFVSKKFKKAMEAWMTGE